MSDIKFFCRSCGKKLGIDSAAIGFMVKCPGCGTENRVPSKSEEPPDSAFAVKRPVLPVRPVSSPPPPPPSSPATAASDSEDLKKTEALQRQLSSLEEERKQWETEKASLVEKEKDMERSLAAAANDVKRASDRAEEAERRKRELEQQVKSLEERAVQLAVIPATEDKLKELEAAFERVSSECNETREKLVESEKEQERQRLHFEQQLSDANDRARILSERAEKAERIHHDLDVKLKEAEDRAAAVSETVSHADRFKEAEESLARTARERDEARKALADLEQRNRELEIKIKTLEAKGTLPLGERERLLRELKAAEEKLESADREKEKVVLARQSLSEELTTLRAEHNAMLQQQHEARALSASLEQLRSQLSELQTQEKKLVNVLAQAEVKTGMSADHVAPATTPPEPRHPPVRRVSPADAQRRVAGIIGIVLLVIVSLLGVWLWWPNLFQSPTEGEIPVAELRSTFSGREKMALTFGVPVTADGLEITVQGARVAPVTIVSMSGIETPSSSHYLIVDVRLINRMDDRSVYLFRTWQDARLVDLSGQPLRQAFTDPVLLGEIKGMADGVDLAAGVEVNDMIIFEWNNERSPGFTLSAEPTFWRRTGEESFVPFSRASLALNIPRDAISGL